MFKSLELFLVVSPGEGDGIAASAVAFLGAVRRRLLRLQLDSNLACTSSDENRRALHSLTTVLPLFGVVLSEGVRMQSKDTSRVARRDSESSPDGPTIFRLWDPWQNLPE
jgi:hypothetical protein